MYCSEDAMVDEISKTLSGFDQSEMVFDEHTVDEALRKLAPEKADDSWEPPFEYVAERTAFGFSDREPDPDDGEDNEWFVPMSAGTNEDGTRWEWPSIRRVDEKMLKYWSDRVRIAKHPVMRARYAGVIWEFTQTVTGKKPEVEIARALIDASIEMSERNCHKHPVDTARNLAHSLRVAISISDRGRIERVRDAIIEYEKKVGDDDKQGLWGRAFDLLYSNKKTLLTEPQRQSLISALEDRLERISNPEIAGSAHDPWGAEAAGQRLATHYRRIGSKEDVLRVLNKVLRAFEHLAKQANPMLAQGWYQQMELLFRNFGLAEEASEIRRKVRELGPAAQKSMAKHEHKIEIPREEMEGYVNEMMGGSLEDAISNFITHNLPRRHETEKELKQLAQKAVMMFLVRRKIVDYKGRPVVALGSLEEDLEGHVVDHTRQSIAMMGIYMRLVIEEMIKRYKLDANIILGWIDESPAFDSSKRPLLQRGLEAYFAKDSVIALHLLVPQIEDAVRTLLELLGGDVYRPNRQGGMDLRTMDDLLRDPLAVQFLSPDVAEYFRVLYTDRRGVNLRNYLSHGMLPAPVFGIGLADRVFHTIVMLAHIRAEKQGQPEQPKS
jgi:hypothetical protein